MQISSKVATQFATTVLTFLAGYLVVHFGLQGNPEVSALIPGLISTLSGLFAGWYVREENAPPKPQPATVEFVSAEAPPLRLQAQVDAGEVPEATPAVRLLEDQKAAAQTQ